MLGVEDFDQQKKKTNEEFIFIFMENSLDMGMRGNILWPVAKKMGEPTGFVPLLWWSYCYIQFQLIWL